MSSIASRSSPTLRPPSACPSKPSAAISSTERRRSSRSVPPCAIPKRAGRRRGAPRAAARPSGSSARPRARAPPRGVRRQADVEAHGDVRSELGLDRGRELGREARLLAVVDRAEGDAVVVGADDRVAEREDLEAAGVGEDRAVPAHEAVQAAELGDRRLARPEVEVVGVAEEDRRPELAQALRVEPLDGRLGAHRHEGGRRHVAVRGAQNAGARLAVRRRHREAHSGASVRIRHAP